MTNKLFDRLKFLEFFDDEKNIEIYWHYFVVRENFRIQLTYTEYEETVGIYFFDLNYSEDNFISSVFIENISKFEFEKTSDRYLLKIYQTKHDQEVGILQIKPFISLISRISE